MANRYWVGTGTWDASNTANWSTTSGGAGGASVPVANDNVYIDQSGSSCTLGYSPPALFSLTCSLGSFINTGNWAMTVSGLFGSFIVSGVGTGRTINLGSATYTVTVGHFTMPSASGFTALTTSSAHITFNTQNQASIFTGGGNTYASFTASANAVGFIIADSNTFTNFYVTGNSGYNYPYAQINANQTIGTLTLNKLSTSRYRIAIVSNTVGTQRTLTVTTLVANGGRIDFRDIIIAGAAAPISGDFGNLGNNSGITFTSKNVYWNKAAGGNWADTDAWALTSGGATSSDNYPLPQDTGIIENTGLNTGATIGWYGYPTIVNGGIDCSTRTNAMTLTIGAGNVVSQMGDVKLSTAATLSLGTTGYFDFARSGTINVTSAGKTFNCYVRQYNKCTVILQDAFTTSNTYDWKASAAGLNLNNFTLTCLSIGCHVNSPQTLAFGTGSIILTGNATTSIQFTTSSNITATGSKNMSMSYSGATGTRNVSLGSSWAEASVPNLAITAGTDIVSLGTNNQYNNVDFTGFAGSWANTASTHFGNLTISTGMTLTAGVNARTFAGTSGTLTITPNGKTFDFPITLSGVGKTFQLGGALTLGSTRDITFSAGTLTTLNYSISSRNFIISGTGVKVFNAGSSTITVSGVVAGGAAFTTSGTTNLTLNAGTFNLVFNGATAKSFSPGAYTYYNITQAGAGDLSILTALTANDIQNTYAAGATSVTLLQSATNTLNSITLAGTTSGNASLLSSLAGTKTKIRIPFGIKTNNSYLTVKDVDAGGGAVFCAPREQGSINNGNNLGWAFTGKPSQCFLVGR